MFTLISPLMSREDPEAGVDRLTTRHAAATALGARIFTASDPTLYLEDIDDYNMTDHIDHAENSRQC